MVINMRKFAQVLQGCLHWKFDGEEAPQFSPEIVIVEITGVAPEPDVGWIYQNGAFTPPEFSLIAMQARAQAGIDAFYQELFDQAVPNSAMKAEYDAAYMVAKKWLETPADPAPERVKALAESYGVTNLQAAQVVVQKWTEAQSVAFDLRGAARLRAKLAIRQALDAPSVAAAEQAGRVAMAAVTFTV